MKKYLPSNVEPKWQKKWEEEGLYSPDLKEKNKYYILAEFPYPSGDLHMGHWFTFTGADIFARLKRMQGYQVFFPNGFDAFGLPAENAAIKRGIHPQDWTMANVKKMKEQFRSSGGSFSFDHEVITCLPEYYRWNQWIFLKMYEKGLAYQGKQTANWCPQCQTVLANEGVEVGLCWRCGSEVVQKEVDQWFLKITDYAEKLLWSDNPSVDWPVSLREAQNNWIGKSEGVVFREKVKDLKIDIEVFDTVPQTFLAQTFVVIAPEHPLVGELVKGTIYEKPVFEFVGAVKRKKARLANVAEKEIEGIFTGRYVEDPFGTGDLPIWVASYAIYEYGSGIVNCSAHDERDFAFAKKYKIPLKIAMLPKDKELAEEVKKLEICYHHAPEGIIQEPLELKGMTWEEAREPVIKYIESKGFGQRQVQYHLRDWSISRQRYWGTPIPMIHCPKCGIVPVPEKDLPVELPYDVDYTPKGKSPLASNEKWLKVKCPKCGEEAERDPDTMDTFVDSSWYFFRYLSPKLDNAPFDQNLAKKMLPVDIYFGGAEHNVGHTLYSRFFTKFFHELGLTDLEEYALKRINHGIVLGSDGVKMSKSKGNVVNPDEEVKKYGADAVRIHLAFFIPYEGTAGPWISERVWGPYRFLERTWNLFDKVTDNEPSKDDLVILNKTIKKVGEDIEGIKFNTAVAALMEWLNYLSRKDKVSREEYRTFLLLLAPLAPHITEELWQLVESSEKAKLKVDSEAILKTESWSIHQQSWPKTDNKYLEEEEVSVVVQVNGKVRDILVIQKDIISSKEVIEKMALASKKAQKFLEGKSVKKVVYVPGKIISFVTSS